MQLLMSLLIVPLLGAITFQIFTTFFRNLKRGESTHNQVVLGPVVTFIFLFAFMYSLLFLH
ncbi:hypothetical protein CUU66_09775 [Peribacillus deserti]|uniref:Uncharacterized protein n=1 Tax=Peribacillus deserti TaxID=673318 RepID=A0A2N5M6N1_9BACI|nr:hypothetical protein CUU66_09775 [Peribacillus deserti]